MREYITLKLVPADQWAAIESLAATHQVKASDLITTTFSRTSLLLYNCVKRVKRLLVSTISDKALIDLSRRAYMNRSNPESLFEVEVLECTPSCALSIGYRWCRWLPGYLSADR